jgi:hypothetical protein
MCRVHDSTFLRPIEPEPPYPSQRGQALRLPPWAFHRCRVAGGDVDLLRGQLCREAGERPRHIRKLGVKHIRLGIRMDFFSTLKCDGRHRLGGLPRIRLASD